MGLRQQWSILTYIVNRYMKGISSIHHLKKILKNQSKATKIQQESAETEGETRTIAIETFSNLINHKTGWEW